MSDSWQCPACTFHNHADLQQCEICDTERVLTKSAPVITIPQQPQMQKPSSASLNTSPVLPRLPSISTASSTSSLTRLPSPSLHRPNSTAEPFASHSIVLTPSAVKLPSHQPTKPPAPIVKPIIPSALPPPAPITVSAPANVAASQAAVPAALTANSPVDSSPLDELQGDNEGRFDLRLIDQLLRIHLSPSIDPALEVTWSAGEGLDSSTNISKVRCDHDLQMLIKAMQQILRLQPTYTFSPLIKKLLWHSFLANGVTVSGLESLSTCLTSLMIASPQSFLPSQEEWETFCQEAKEFSIWLQQKDQIPQNEAMKKLKEQMLNTNANELPSTPSAASSSSTSGAAKHDATIAATAYQALQTIHRTLRTQADQELLYARWIQQLRYWTLLFQLDCHTRERGIEWFQTRVQSAKSKDRNGTLKSEEPSIDSTASVLTSLIIGCRPILTYASMLASKKALAMKRGPQVLSAEEESEIAFKSELSNPVTKKGKRKSSTDSKSVTNRSATPPSLSKQSLKKRSTSVSPSNVAAHANNLDRRASKRQKNPAGFYARLDRGADEQDDDDDDNDASIYDDDEGGNESVHDEEVAVDDSFLAWWNMHLGFLGLLRSSGNPAAAAENEVVIATFRSSKALHIFQQVVSGFIELLTKLHVHREQKNSTHK